MSDEQLQSAVAEVIDGGITPDEAVVLATSPEVLDTLTQEQAVEVFDSLEITELSEEQALLLVNAVQNAPEEVREAFEESIDVFSGATDTYVPIGSSVPVSTRRAVIAVTGLLAIASVSTTSVSSKR
jgi:hypothetical protein